LRLRLPVVTVALLAALAPGARAADPGRWRDAGRSVIPIQYFQGVTSNPRGSLWFDGITFGLYRTSPALTQVNGVDNVIPPEVSASEGYNHIGDLSFDPTSGSGRILLPLECYDPGRKPANFCGTGSIGVADPATLAWQYYVKLDPADIPKARWCEIDPSGRLLWTSSGDDLLAYSTTDVSLPNAAPTGPAIRPVKRLAGAVPQSGITGATFYAGRLFVAGADGTTFQVWSIDTRTGARRLEIERTYSGESEGLDSVRGLNGVLHWQVQPVTSTPPPTFAEPSLLHLLPTPRPALQVRVSPRAVDAGERTAVTVTVRGAWRAARQELPGATVTLAGQRKSTRASGEATFRLRPAKAGRLRVRATALGEAPGTASVQVR
jgi:hypothetical protein